jgi:hypothetical protein
MSVGPPPGPVRLLNELVRLDSRPPEPARRRLARYPGRPVRTVVPALPQAHPKALQIPELSGMYRSFLSSTAPP